MIIFQTKFNDGEKLWDRIGCEGEMDMTQATIRRTALYPNDFNICGSVLYDFSEK